MKVGGAKWPRKAGRQIQREIVVQGRVRLWWRGGIERRTVQEEEGMNE